MLFTKRAVALPTRLLDLREQLEFLEVTEAGARNRRRDRIKFIPGGASGVAAHDDLFCAFALACECLEGEAGRMILPPMRTCLKMANEGRSHPGCYLIEGCWNYPANNDPSCSQCPGHVAARAMYEGYLASGGEPYSSIREFYKERCRGNDFTSLFTQRNAERWLGL
jgi:hypothetical protein